MKTWHHWVGRDPLRLDEPHSPNHPNDPGGSGRESALLCRELRSRAGQLMLCPYDLCLIVSIDASYCTSALDKISATPSTPPQSAEPLPVAGAVFRPSGSRCAPNGRFLRLRARSTSRDGGRNDQHDGHFLSSNTEAIKATANAPRQRRPLFVVGK